MVDGAPDTLPSFEETQPIQPVAVATDQGANPEQLLSNQGLESQDQLPAFDESMQTPEEAYGSLGQELKTFAEGAGRGASFGLSTGAEELAGVTPEAIKARQQTNPFFSGAGETAGLLGSTLIPGVGEANVLSKLGEAATAVVGLGEAAAPLVRIGSKAVQLAVETAAYQGTDEIHKMLLKDPDQTASTALMDIGLAGALGAAGGSMLGGASELWKAAGKSKVAGLLGAVADKMGGVEGVDPLDEAISRSGVDITPEQRALMAQDPGLKELGQELAQTATSTGTKVRASREDFFNKAQEQLGAALGKTPEDIKGLESLSEYDSGNNIKDSLVNSIKEMVEPVSKQFEKIKETYGKVALSDLDKQGIMDSVAQMSVDHGYNLSPAAPQAKLLNRVIDELPNIKTAQDLRKYASVIYDSTSNPEMWRVGGQLKSIFRGAEEGIVEKTLADQAPDLLATHAEARASYKKIMDTIDNLNERVHVGKYAGPDSFVKALQELPPEDVLRRLATKSDVGLLNELQAKFPTVADSVKEYHIDKMLKLASDKALPNQLINVNTLNTQLDKLSPELKSFMLSPESQVKLAAINQVLERMPRQLGPDTARLIDSMAQGVPGALGAVIGAASHGVSGGAIGAVIGNLAKYAAREGTDATKYAFLKFMTTPKAVDAEGFKQMVDLINSTLKGEAALTKAAKAIFKPGAEVLTQSAQPSESHRIKIDKYITKLAQNPTPLLMGGTKTAYYMPETASSMVQQMSQTGALIQHAKPGQNKQAPLDNAPVISKGQKAEYDNVLNIAQQPLWLLHKAGEGTLTQKDVQILKSMNPAALIKIQSAISKELVNNQAKGIEIPYKTRIGLSLLLGSPVDSTLSQSSIMRAQMVQQSQGGPAAAQQQSSAPISKTNKLSKLPGLYSTPGQLATSKRIEE